MADATTVFEEHAREYDALRRRLVPAFDGFYAAGRTTASLEVHRRYYRSSEQGRLIAASAV